MYYIKMPAKRHFRDSTNQRRKNKIFLNNTKNKVVISTENEYKSLDWAYNKALEIIKKEF